MAQPRRAEAAAAAAAPPRDGAKLGLTVGILALDVSGTGTLPARRLLYTQGPVDSQGLAIYIHGLFSVSKKRLFAYRKNMDSPCMNVRVLKMPNDGYGFSNGNKPSVLVVLDMVRLGIFWAVSVGGSHGRQRREAMRWSSKKTLKTKRQKAGRCRRRRAC